MKKISNKINEIKWKKFFISGEEGVYSINSTSSGIDKNKLNLLDIGNTPYITRTDVNNGINLFISNNQNEKYKKDLGNAITIGLDTQTVFYQNHEFFTGQNIQVVKNDSINKFNALFSITLLKKQMEKFNWGGNGATLGRLSRTSILLPVDDNNKTDIEYMEMYSKTKINKKYESYKSYANNRLKKLKYKKIIPLNEKKWSEFFIEDIAIISSGRDIYEKERIIGNTPYVTSTSSNNGIGYYVSNVNDTLERNCISVNRNGSVGYSFFHPYNALISNDCRKLVLKEHSNYIALFITNQITMQKEKYNYGYKMGTGRLKRQKILLPINDDENPDFEYMEQYIKNMMYTKIKKYLDYIDKKD